MIVGSRIRLRALEREDLRLFWKWENDAEIMEFASCSPERSVSFATIERVFENNLCPGPGGPWYYLILGEDDQGIGIANWWVPNTRFSRSAELGLYIGERDHWRRGLGIDVIVTLTGVLLDSFGMHRVGMTYGSYNHRMDALVRRYCIPIEGVVKEERYMRGQFFDTVRVGILRGTHDRIRQELLEGNSRP